jgi:hypothetical protein
LKAGIFRYVSSLKVKQLKLGLTLRGSFAANTLHVQTANA